jgi:rhamnosyltransferase
VKIAGVVVLYNPSEDVYRNILSYIDQVSKLYVVDNSTVIRRDVVNRITTHTNAVYLSANGNKGIGYALNIGASNAAREGYDLLLTMDQDTKLFPGYVSALVKHVDASTGIVAPWYKGSMRTNQDTEEVMYAMTSGNLLKIDAWTKAGDFKSEFFIDHIDHEYGLRLNSKGSKVLQINTVELDHKPGVTHTWSFLGLRFHYVIHSPERNYYFTRNGLYVSDMYRGTKWNFGSIFRKLLLKNILKAIVHRDQRGRRMQLIWRGYKDYRKNKTGKLDETGNTR